MCVHASQGRIHDFGKGGGVRISVKLLKHLWFACIRATFFFSTLSSLDVLKKGGGV